MQEPACQNQYIFMRIYFVNIASGLLIFALAFVNLSHAQYLKRLPIKYLDKKDSTYSIYLEERTNLKSLPEDRHEYWIRVKGFSSRDLELSWNYERHDELNRKVKSTTCLTMKRMQKVDRFIRIASATDFGNLCVDDYVIPKPIELPGRDDMTVNVLSPLGGLYFIGDTIVMKAEAAGHNQLTDWGWKTPNEKESTGQIYRFLAKESVNYMVYGKFKGCDDNYVYTDTITLPVKLKNRNDLDFRIVGPEKKVDDTSTFTLGIEITKNLLGEKLDWKWYKSIKGKLIYVGHGISYTQSADSVLTDSVFVACAYARGREVRCKTYILPLNRLPGPDKFDLYLTDSNYCNGTAKIVACSRGREPQRWTWTVDDIPVDFFGDTLVISNPMESMRVCAYPTLNRRGGSRLQKCIVLPKCNKTIRKLFEIDGRMQRCSGDTGNIIYYFRHSSKSDKLIDEGWLLYESDIPLREVLITSDTIHLNPSKTTIYRIISTIDRTRTFDFKIEVISRPAAPGNIKGPDLICPYESFQLRAEGTQPAAIRWIWMKAVLKDEDAKMEKVGEGPTISDTLEEHTIYTLYAEDRSCRSLITRTKTVRVIEQQSVPSVKKMRYRRRGSVVDIELTGSLGIGETYEWSDNEFRTVAYVGKERKSIRLGVSSRVMHVRIRNACGTFSNILELNLPSVERIADPYVMIKVIVYRVVVRYGIILTPRVVVIPERTIRVDSEGYPGFFINSGIVTNGSDLFQNFRLTLGKGRIYASVYFNPLYLLRSGEHERLYAGKSLEINNSGRITNFPSSTGNYYEVNGVSISNRTGLSVGMMFNLKYLNLTVGTGYGTRSLFWGLDMKSYANDSRVSRVWARNSDLNWKGLSLDAGIFKDFGGFNMMFGMHTILDPDRPSPYTEAGIGIGINLGKR
jgi:hypothetical protein